MRPAQPSRKPTFIWQAGLILLPVVVLTAVGLFSLEQDRRLTEQDAQTAGATIARRLAGAMNSAMVRQLGEYHTAIIDLHATWNIALGLSTSPGGATMPDVKARIDTWQKANPDIDLTAMPAMEMQLSLAGHPWDSDSRTTVWERIQKWQQEYRGFDLSAMSGVTGLFADSTQLQLYPPSPSPPDWLSALSPKQNQLWREVETAEFVSGNRELALAGIKKFLAAQPPGGARANAEFHQLLIESQGLSPAAAVTNLAASHWSISGDLDEAGIPIGQLLCYRALRLLNNGAGVPENLLHNIARAIQNRPSMLVPQLIAEAERAAGPESSGTRSRVAMLMAWWNSNDRTLQIFREITAHPPSNPLSGTLSWIVLPSGTWLVAQDGGTPGVAGSATGHLLVFPQAVVDRALNQGLTQADITVPPYAIAALEIGGKRQFWRWNNQASVTNTATLPLLGEAVGALSLPIGTVAFPFQVRILLADRDALYARQHQRTLWFSVLIMASTLAALTGLLSAYRAFRRQQELSELKSNFVSSVSHELRAPIASVRLMAENLESGKIPGPAKQQEYYQFIVQECRRLSSLIENVLDFSRIEQGRKQYELEPTDLASLVATTVKLMEPYAVERGVSLRLEPAGRPTDAKMEATVDGQAIQQALVNLIDNATKHSAAGQTVLVALARHVSPPTPALDISVTDQGPGIPAAEQEKIFERFYRRGSELRRETQGIGIGLSLVKHIVEAHDGRVTVDSEPGRGSRFTLEIPLRKTNE